LNADLPHRGSWVKRLRVRTWGGGLCGFALVAFSASVSELGTFSAGTYAEGPLRTDEVVAGRW